MITREFTEDELHAVNMTEIDSERIRWGSRVTYVFPLDECHWMVTIDLQPEHGWQIYGTVTGTKVHAVERVVTTTTWEPAP